jgi:hypothetical protein
MSCGYWTNKRVTGVLWSNTMSNGVNNGAQINEMARR